MYFVLLHRTPGGLLKGCLDVSILFSVNFRVADTSEAGLQNVHLKYYSGVTKTALKALCRNVSPRSKNLNIIVSEKGH